MRTEKLSVNFAKFNTQNSTHHKTLTQKTIRKNMVLNVSYTSAKTKYKLSITDTSLTDPKTDFEVNALGTFNILETARRSGNNPSFIYCSTNKVYGENVNRIGVKEKERRYIFERKFRKGVPESFPMIYANIHPTVALS